MWFMVNILILVSLRSWLTNRSEFQLVCDGSRPVGSKQHPAKSKHTRIRMDLYVYWTWHPPHENISESVCVLLLQTPLSRQLRDLNMPVAWSHEDALRIDGSVVRIGSDFFKWTMMNYWASADQYQWASTVMSHQNQNCAELSPCFFDQTFLINKSHGPCF